MSINEIVLITMIDLKKLQRNILFFYLRVYLLTFKLRNGLKFSEDSFHTNH